MRDRDEQALTVAALNRAVRLGLEHEFGDVWVTGEISDLTSAASGHVYFTLCDEAETAQLRAVMFRSDALRSRAKLENGARVRIRGGLTLYEARGSYQMIAKAALPAGDGELAARFRKVLHKLEAEGLLDPAKKRALPLLPRCVGLVTSTHGAAVHDVIRVANERCPVRIVVANCLVQGPEAPGSIVRALAAIQKLPELDVVIVARGGGSAEDLWAFNDEQVARAIAGCRVPVVSGVGHEVDVTIADLVADVRAATPSNAAEIVVPERDALSEQLSSALRRLSRALDSRIDREHLVLSRLLAKLRDPQRALGAAETSLTRQKKRLERAMAQKLERARVTLGAQTERLAPHDPRARLSSQRERLTRLRMRIELSEGRWLHPRARLVREHEARMHGLIEKRLTLQRHALASLMGRLDALSPLAVLSRGYSIAFHVRTGRALRSASDSDVGDAIRVRLAQGELLARVEQRLSADEGE